MRTSLPLLFSLGSTLVLVTVVVVFMQGASDGLPSPEASPNLSYVPGVLLNEGLTDELTGKKPLRAPLTRSELKPRMPSQTPASSGFSASPAKRSERGDASANGGVWLPAGEHQRTGEQSAGFVRGKPGKESKRITRLQVEGLGLPGFATPPKTGAPVVNREPTKESVPNAEPAGAATPVPQATRTSISTDTKVTSSTEPAPAVLSVPAKRGPWPRGPFTPEEELYRAQYGATALSDALREEALGPEKP